MNKKSQQNQPLMYITLNLAKKATCDMQSEYRIKLNTNPKKNNAIENSDQEPVQIEETNKIEEKTEEIKDENELLKKASEVLDSKLLHDHASSVVEETDSKLVAKAKAEAEAEAEAVVESVKEVEEEEKHPDVIKEIQGVVMEKDEILSSVNISDSEIQQEVEKLIPKSYGVVRKELFSPFFYDLNTLDKIKYLTTLPKFINQVMVEIKLNSRLYIGKIYSYQRDENTIMLLNTNNLKMIKLDINEIITIKVISL